MPIVPGTRVTEAEAKPARSAAGVDQSPSARRVDSVTRAWTVTGRLSATKERAVADARRKLRDEVASWLDPEVPRSWTPPARLLDAMVVDEPRVKSIQKDYGELFEATLTVDTSPQRRTALIEVYNRQLVERRLASLGGDAGIYLDLPGRCFRLHSRRRGDQGLLHQSAEDAGRRRCRCLGRDHLPHGRLTGGIELAAFDHTVRCIGKLLAIHVLMGRDERIGKRPRRWVQSGVEISLGARNPFRGRLNRWLLQRPMPFWSGTCARATPRPGAS